jgi:hypothetical protein
MLKLLLILAFLFSGIKVYGEEVAVTPIPQGDTIVGWELVQLSLITDPWGGEARITIVIAGKREDGECALDARGKCAGRRFEYEGAEARTMISTLNTANLTSNSLRKRIFTKLLNDGKIESGAVVGTPGIKDPPPTATVPASPF